MKITFRIPRPWVLDPDFPPVKSAVSHATGYSFPSGHTQGGTCLFAPLAMKAGNRILKVLFTAAFLLIGFSRMYLGVHTPKDVLAALTVSLAFSWFFSRFSSRLFDHIRTLCIVLAICAFAVLLYACLLMHLDRLAVRYAADCIKAAGAGLGFAAGLYLEQTRLRFSTAARTRTAQAIKLLAGLFFHTPVQAVPLGPWLRPALESICLRFPRFLDSVFISCPLCIRPEKIIVFSFYCLYFSDFVSKLIAFNIFFSYL